MVRLITSLSMFFVGAFLGASAGWSTLALILFALFLLSTGFGIFAPHVFRYAIFAAWGFISLLYLSSGMDFLSSAVYGFGSVVLFFSNMAFPARRVG